MTELPRVFADFNELLGSGHRLRLDTVGAKADLEKAGVRLEHGLALLLYDHDENLEGERDDLIVEGRAVWDEGLSCWVAEIDRSAIRHESDDGRSG